MRMAVDVMALQKRARGTVAVRRAAYLSYSDVCACLCVCVRVCERDKNSHLTTNNKHEFKICSISLLRRDHITRIWEKYASEFLSRVTKVGIYNVALLQPTLEFYEHRQ